MSILLSAYYPEGIVFTADKNVTTIQSGKRSVVPTGTKVLGWPSQKAVVGCVGLFRLGGTALDDWMQHFVAQTMDFDSLDTMAHTLRDRIQEDFNKDYPPGTTLTVDHVMVIHLGGFATRGDIETPVMYHIWNHGNRDPKTGGYPRAERHFKISEDIERDFKNAVKAQSRISNQSGSMNDWLAKGYPEGVKDWLAALVKAGTYMWYNNGANLAAFNTFKGVIWDSLRVLQDAGFAPGLPGLTNRIAFCKMAVEVFGAYFTHYYEPNYRIVGGPPDDVSIPWPD